MSLFFIGARLHNLIAYNIMGRQILKQKYGSKEFCYLEVATPHMKMEVHYTKERSSVLSSEFLRVRREDHAGADMNLTRTC